jgi:Mrp family chromosome partitioning ATPase
MHMSNSIKVNESALDHEHMADVEPTIVPGPHNPRLAARDVGSAPQRRGAEPYDALLWRLQARQAPDVVKSITLGIVGCAPRVGVSTVATNVAWRASELQLGPVLLVETSAGSVRRNSLWSLDTGPGLAQLLAGEATYAECLRPGPAPDLSVIPAGPLARGEVGLLDPGSIDAFLAEACADHRLVVFDLPSADKLQQMLMLAKQLDQVLLVVRSDASRERDIQRVADRLIEDGVPLSGAVLNRQRTYLPRWLSRWV